MGDVATQVRQSKAATNRSASTSQAVLAALADVSELSLAGLRERLTVGSAGITESQLTRALRQLVADGSLVRPRRGYYAVAAMTSDTAGSDDLKSPAAVPVPAARAATAKVPAQRSQIASKPQPSSADGPLARPLGAAPRRPRRTAKPPTPRIISPVPPASQVSEDPPSFVEPPLVDEAVVSEPAVAVIATVAVAESVAVIESVAVDTPSSEATVYHTAVVEAVTGEASIGEPVLVAEPTSVSESAVQVEDVSDPAEHLEIDTLSRPTPPQEFESLERRMWLSKAALPVLWFALTGIALMLGGALIGILGGVAFGVGAVALYRRERHRELALRNGALAPSSSGTDHIASIDSIGVR